MKKLLSLLLVLVMCLSFVACGTNNETATADTATTEATTAPVSKGSTPLLYKATSDNGGEVWLFGSIHVGNDDMYPLPDYVNNAYNEADSLAVEVDVIDMEENAMDYVSDYQKVMYLDGTTIKDHISEDLYNDAVKILEDNDYYTSMLDYYYPSMWSSFIEVFEYENCGYDSKKGIDMHLLNLAKENKKNIVEIESASSQITLLGEFSEELQILQLEEVVAGYNTEESKTYLKDLVSAWTSGNEESITAIICEDSSSEDYTEEEMKLLEEYKQKMLVDRNILMADFAEKALKDGDSVFICVGTAHIVGEGAMVDLLRDRGYTVEIVK